jgi:hypothetical protein
MEGEEAGVGLSLGEHRVSRGFGPASATQASDVLAARPD